MRIEFLLGMSFVWFAAAIAILAIYKPKWLRRFVERHGHKLS